MKESELKIKKLNDKLKGKRSPIYIARKGDQTDEALAQFLNNYPEREKLKILFIRESEGNYRFGTKRVFVQVGRGNQITVKVGGGFIRVEEFIKQYSISEADRITRNNPIERIQKKIKLQSIVSNLATDAKETSPIRQT